MADYHVCVGQQFTITMETGVDLTDYSGETYILIKDPDGNTSQVEAEISDAENGAISYTFPADTGLTISGDWEVKSYIDYTVKTPGKTYVLSVLERFENSGYPTAQEIRDYLEGYCVTEDRISSLRISRMRKMVVKWLEYRTDLTLGETQSYTEYLSGTGKSLLLLSRKPIESLDRIEYVNSYDDYTASMSNVELNSEEGVLKAVSNFNEDRYPIFPKGTYNIKVTYTAGCSVIPDELYEAIMALTSEKILALMEGKTGGVICLPEDIIAIMAPGVSIQI
jgi:hypothetical protein